MRTVSVDEFHFSEVSVDYPCDVTCLACGYRGSVDFTDEYLQKWDEYTNPNYERIVADHRQYLRWIYIRPDAVKYINDNIDYLCCPKCRKARLAVTPESYYSLRRILESLQCHTT